MHWSTRIEGNRLSLEEARESSRRVFRSKERIRERNPGPRQEILNHLYSYFFGEETKLPWDLDNVRLLHRFLMDGTGEDCRPGEIRRNEEMAVRSDDGIETFIACPAVHVEDELAHLLEWTNTSAYDPMITAVVFFHEFESIHPFTEGNGRVGRSMFHILMQELGFVNFNLCRFEDKIVGNSRIYYALLEYTDSYGDYTPLTEYFIDCTHQAYSEAVEYCTEKDALKDMDFNGRAIALRARESGEWFSVHDAGIWTKNLTDQTVRMKLNVLVDLGILEKEGQTR